MDVNLTMTLRARFRAIRGIRPGPSARILLGSSGIRSRRQQAMSRSRPTCHGQYDQGQPIGGMTSTPMSAARYATRCRAPELQASSSSNDCNLLRAEWKQVVTPLHQHLGRIYSVMLAIRSKSFIWKPAAEADRREPNHTSVKGLASIHIEKCGARSAKLGGEYRNRPNTKSVSRHCSAVCCPDRAPHRMVCLPLIICHEEDIRRPHIY